jgi:hypothetical protein
MENGKVRKETLFSLFNGAIEGRVKNQVTGNIHPRKEVMDHYRYLIKRSLDDPADVRIRRMLRIVADLLDIPSDIHDRLMEEAWKDRSKLRDASVRLFVKADIEATYNLLTGETFLDPAPLEERMPTERRMSQKEMMDLKRKGLLEDHKGLFDKDEMDTYSTLMEMEKDDMTHDPGTSILDTERDSPMFSDGWGRRSEGSKVGNQGLTKPLKK